MNSETLTVIGEFAQWLSSTRRGARPARRLALHELDVWGVPYGSELSCAAAQIVAELAVNAVTHGHVPGRDFELRLALDEACLRIEVADARSERWPELREADPVGVSGRGLRLVEALADDRGVLGRSVGKTVWAAIGREPERGNG